MGSTSGSPSFQGVILTLLQLSSLVASQSLIDPTSKDNSPQCQCYLVSGSNPGYFQYHRFWDFRNISDDDNNDYTVAPALITASQNQGIEAITSSYLNSSKFTADWAIQNGSEDPEAIVPTVNSAQNVFIARNSTKGAESSTFLTMRTNRLPTFMSTAQIESNQNNLLHASIRARFRIIPNGLSNSSFPSAGDTRLTNAAKGSNTSHPVDDGACFGFFTYQSDTQEIDIELLTSGPTTDVHYTNQPDYDAKADKTIPGASSDVALPNAGRYTEWQTHRLDWFPTMTQWFVDGNFVLNKTLNVPVKPSFFIVNLWGDGGNWTGNMTVGGQVSVAIEWIEMAFNVSGNVKTRSSGGGGGCEVACNVDGVKSVGFPELAYNRTSTSGAGKLIVFGGKGNGWLLEWGVVWAVVAFRAFFVSV